MATYNVRELLDRLHGIYDEDYKFCDVSILDSDEDSPEALCIDPYDLDDVFSFGDEPIDSCDATEIESYSITGNSLCHEISFTFSELSSLHKSIKISLHALKEEEKTVTTREDKDVIKETAIALRNLDAKFAKMFKNIY